jgi:hypothetical protein
MTAINVSRVAQVSRSYGGRADLARVLSQVSCEIDREISVPTATIEHHQELEASVDRNIIRHHVR